ncbi:hypothetical protein VCHA53O466_50038 [Vibrio chagasii]|nr:hypothetical protein VCHA53O466_50038 [Vibrio chagasii]
MARRLQIDSLEKSGKDIWHDRDTIMLHAAFQLLKDFIEKEEPQGISLFAKLAYTGEEMPEEEKIHCQGDDYLTHIDEWKRLFALYQWWDGHVSLESQITNGVELYKLEQEKLEELVKLRKLMWI